MVNRRRLVTTGLGALALSGGLGSRPDRVAASGGSMIQVPTYAQQRNLSCEYASAVIAMASFGSWVSGCAFDPLVGWSPNPHLGFRGDINGVWGNTVDYGVYAEPLAAVLPTFGLPARCITLKAMLRR